MGWPNNITDCTFILHTVWITIQSKKPWNLLSDLMKYLPLMSIPLKENSTKKPILPEIFMHRTYFRFGSFEKLFLIHDKHSAKRGIDGLLCLYGVTILDLLKIELILQKSPSVSGFHFCKIEFTWDFFPDSSLKNSTLVSKLIKIMHISHARDAWNYKTKKHPKQVTYYINYRKSDIQGKIYPRPKKPDSKARQLTRIEIITGKRWLASICLITPSDFLNLAFDKIVSQIKFLEFRWDKIRNSNQNHLITGGFSFDLLRSNWEFLGISYCIIKHRKQYTCPARCNYRGHLKNCPLYRAYNKVQRGSILLYIIRDCPHSITQPRFEATYTCKSRHSDVLMNMMRKAYLTWNSPPSSPITVTPLPPKSSRKNACGKSHKKTNP